MFTADLVKHADCIRNHPRDDEHVWISEVRISIRLHNESERQRVLREDLESPHVSPDTLSVAL